MRRFGTRSSLIRLLSVVAAGSGLVLCALAVRPLPASAEVTTTTSAGPSATIPGGSTTTTAGVSAEAVAAASAPLFSDDPFDEAEAGVNSHPWSDPLAGVQGYVTRGQLAIRVADLLGLEGSTTCYFSDVRGPEDCFGAVGALHEAKLLTGATASEFLPDEAVSRQQALVWIVDALAYKLSDDEGSTTPFRFSYFESVDGWLGGFHDRGMVADVLSRGVANAYRLGIVDASTDGYLYPVFPVSETEIEVMLDRAFERPIQARAALPEPVTAKAAYATQKLESEGSLVWYLEYRLAALKYRPGPIDGIFDIRTRDAVMAFQKVERLKRDGVAGDTFWERLAAAERCVPKLDEPGARVEIDLTRQVLFMISDNEVRKIVHVSSGDAQMATLTGYFEVDHKMPRWAISSYRTAMYYSSFFDFEHKLAVHGYAQVPPWPASHGCVRVPMWMAKEIYEEMPMGTKVYVYKS